MSYSIKQVAAMLGISPQTLRFYERYGIDAGNRADDSGYRSYSHAGVDELMSIRKYRNSGFTLADSAKALKCADPDAVADMLAAQAQVLQKEAAQKMLIAQKLQHVAQSILTRDSAPETIQMPALLCARVINEARQPDETAYRMLKTWVQWMPMAQWALFISPDFQTRFYGFTIEAENAEICGVKRDVHCFDRSERVCVCQPIAWKAQKESMFSVALPYLEALRAEYGPPADDVMVQTLINRSQQEGVFSHGLIFYPTA